MALFLARGCDNEKAAEGAILEYTANTRGFYERITIADRTVSIADDREAGAGTAVQIAEADWDQIVTLFKHVDLDKLAELKAPSEKRFYDGAAIANLKITYDGRVYESQAFDHGAPPAEIAALVNIINEFSQRK